MRLIITTVDEFELENMRELLARINLAGEFIKKIEFTNDKDDSKDGSS